MDHYCSVSFLSTSSPHPVSSMLRFPTAASDHIHISRAFAASKGYPVAIHLLHLLVLPILPSTSQSAHSTATAVSVSRCCRYFASNPEISLFRRFAISHHRCFDFPLYYLSFPCSVVVPAAISSRLCINNLRPTYCSTQPNPFSARRQSYISGTHAIPLPLPSPCPVSSNAAASKV